MQRALIAALTVLLLGCFALGQQPPPAKPAPAPPPTVITRALLEQRLAQLERERQQVLANLNAYVGAIQETQHWLATLAPEAADSKPAKKDKPKP